MACSFNGSTPKGIQRRLAKRRLQFGRFFTKALCVKDHPITMPFLVRIPVTSQSSSIPQAAHLALRLLRPLLYYAISTYHYTVST